MQRLAAVVSIFSSLLTLIHAVEIVSGSSCDCFLTNGTQATYFANRIFFDFRKLNDYAGVPGVISNADDTPKAPPTSDYFKSTSWTATWALQTWTNSRGNGDGLRGDATVLMIHSPNNVYIEKNEDTSASSAATFLTLRTARLAEFQTAAEFKSRTANYHYLSLRMLARTVGSPGAVSAVFTYRDAEKLADIQEADMEVLTRGPENKVQYTNQPGYTDRGSDVANATRNATLPRGLKWSDWAVYRLDWTPTRSVWYVDGEEVANIAFQVPRDPASVNINSWGNGGSWSGNMSVGTESKLQLQWIEMVYNTTEDNRHRQSKRHEAGAGRGRPWAPAQLLARDGKSTLCGAVCSIDEGSQTGAVAKLWGVKNSSVRTSASWCFVAVVAGLCAALGSLA
ncbi:Concanavalin A-like lectin/glucanase [Metarhizium album ARSEF 1941]|uniref:Concanavalin A-like lectin/glucanase n=1 Tax=Metarhizium album (strain ARSEF 1941) TaxID=1081103 RepID=A0A0B2X000_METAS|nr:Concanavalin A-like lectin/glucanase [Metarhizium album ARSEF 1941]KHN99628.1 Concanavalin A-like lectin/glucanase [Metarhizium album ARSEF 1941]